MPTGEFPLFSILCLAKATDWLSRISIDAEYLEGNVYRLLLGSVSDLWEDEEGNPQEEAAPPAYQ